MQVFETISNAVVSGFKNTFMTKDESEVLNNEVIVVERFITNSAISDG